MSFLVYPVYTRVVSVYIQRSSLCLPMNAGVHDAEGPLLEVCEKLHAASKHLINKKLGIYDPQFTGLSLCFVDYRLFTLKIQEFIIEVS